MPAFKRRCLHKIEKGRNEFLPFSAKIFSFCSCRVYFCAVQSNHRRKQNLLHIDTPLSRIRGTFYDYNGIPVLATYHPSALLREPANKRYAWEDLKLFKSKLLECRPDYAKGFTERG